MASNATSPPENQSAQTGNMRFGLTRRQRDAFNFIREFRAEHGVSPSYVDITDGLGLRSKSGVNRLLNALEERGYIRRAYHRARSVVIIGEEP